MGRLRSDDLDFHLTGFEIAQHKRPYNEHRLLVYESSKNQIKHIMFNQLEQILRKDDLLVFNNTMLIPASIYLSEEDFILFIEPQFNSIDNVRVICPFKPKEGDTFQVGGSTIELTYHEPGWDVYRARIITNECSDLAAFLDRYAKIPMPIYLKRIPDDDDISGMQNFYAKFPGSIATPVAGLHFNTELVEHLHSIGIRNTEVTLHVGYGTFRSFKTEFIDQHVMDSEYYEVSEDAIKEIKRAMDIGSRVIAVGTTSSRVLETIANRDDWANSKDIGLSGETSIFIYPPYDFKIVDGLITNFQYPRLPVLAMAAALTGLDDLKNVYYESLKEKYLYYSYGDAMLLLK